MEAPWTNNKNNSSPSAEQAGLSNRQCLLAVSLCASKERLWSSYPSAVHNKLVDKKFSSQMLLRQLWTSGGLRGPVDPLCLYPGLDKVPPGFGASFIKSANVLRSLWGSHSFLLSCCFDTATNWCLSVENPDGWGRWYVYSTAGCEVLRFSVAVHYSLLEAQRELHVLRDADFYKTHIFYQRFSAV